MSTYLGSIVSLGGNIVLARILSPNDFGTYAFASSLLLLIFMIAGFGSQESIVQCRDSNIHHLVSTSFWITLALGIVLAIAGTALGLLVTRVYDSITGAMIIWLSWSKLISMVGYIYRSILQRDLNYRPMALVTIVTNIFSMLLAIVAARAGWGIWALLVREMSQMSLLLVGLIWVCPYQLEFIVDKEAAAWIWNFGWKMMSHRIGEEIFERADKLTIGTFLGTTLLGQYSVANRLAIVGYQFSQGMVEPVAFSTFATVQNAPEKLQAAFHRFYYWLFRFVLIFFLVVWQDGSGIINVVYGDKWQVAGTVFQHMAPLMLLIPVNKGLATMLIASGRVDAVLRIRVWQLLCFVPMLLIIARWGNLIGIVWAVNLGFLLNSVLQMRAISRSVTINWQHLMTGALTAAGIASLISMGAKSFLYGTNITLTSVSIGIVVTAVAYAICLLAVEWRSLLTEWRLIHNYSTII